MLYAIFSLPFLNQNENKYNKTGVYSIIYVFVMENIIFSSSLERFRGDYDNGRRYIIFVIIY